MQDTVHKEETDSRRHTAIIWLACLLYGGSILFKGIYASSLVEIIADLSITKAEAGYALTAYYLTYAAGQVVFGKCLKRYNPALKIGISYLLSAVLLLAFALCRSLPILLVIWGIHGFVQAVIWPGVIDLQSRYLPGSLLENSAVIVASGLPFATVASYLLTSLSVYAWKWNTAFYIAAALALFGGLLTLFLFLPFLRATKERKKNNPFAGEALQKKPHARVKGSGAIFVFSTLIIVLISYIRHAVTNWLPNMLTEIFDAPAYFSIVLTIAVAVLSLFGSYAVKVFRRFVHNYFTIVAIATGIEWLSVLLLRLSYAFSMPAAVILSSVLVMFVSCCNIVVISVVPLKMRDSLDAGNFSAMMNAFSGVAIAATTTLSGAIIDGFGWGMFYDVNGLLLALVLLAALFAASVWKKRE